MANDTCPIWGTPARILPTSRDGIDVNSPRVGGQYFISGTASAVLKRFDETFRARLTSWIVEQRRLGVESPEVVSSVFDDIEHRRPLSVHDRADRLLILASSRVQSIGTHFCFALRYLNDELRSWVEDEAFSEMKAWSESLKDSEVSYLVEFLVRRQFLERKSFVSGSHSGKHDPQEYLITPEGYAYVAEQEKRTVNSAQAFVAMWFDDSMTDAFEMGLAPAVRDAGYEPLRIDGKEHNNKIDDEIIAEIRRSRFLVADFTPGTDGPRGGVYYEAGFASGLNIPVVFTCREDVIRNVHFDTRQFNHITWKTPEDLRLKLAQRISATIGDGPLKKS